MSGPLGGDFLAHTVDPLMFCFRSLRALSGSLARKTFLFSRNNRLICCASVFPLP